MKNEDRRMMNKGQLSFDSGYKQYELSNHLPHEIAKQQFHRNCISRGKGNFNGCLTLVKSYYSHESRSKYNEASGVLVTIQDRKWGIQTTSGNNANHYIPYIVTTTDYYAFGSSMVERSQSFGEIYKFGFNNQEKEGELGDYYSFEYRVHDARLGRFLSVDPLAPQYPWNSCFAFAENTVIQCKDLEGLEKFIATIVPSGDAQNTAPDGVVSIRLSIVDDQDIESQTNECLKAGVNHMISWDGGLTFLSVDQYKYEYLKCFLDNTKVIEQCFLIDLRTTDNPPKTSTCGSLSGAKTLSFGTGEDGDYYFEWSSVLSMPDNKIVVSTPVTETIIKNKGELSTSNFTREYTAPASADGKALVTIKIGGGDYSNLVSFTDISGNPIQFTVGDDPKILKSFTAGNEAGETYDAIITFTVDANSKFNVIISPNADNNSDAWNYDIFINGTDTTTDPCDLDKIEGIIGE